MIEDRFFLSKTDFDFLGKTVLVRIDCDIDLRNEAGKLVVDEDFRLKQAIPTIKYLLGKGTAKIILLGHLGRPDGGVVEDLKLAPVAEWFLKQVDLSSRAQSRDPSLSTRKRDSSTFSLRSIGRNDDVYGVGENLFLLENLRFNEGEEQNNEGFARELAKLGDVFINEAFGVSHRDHASITGIPKFLPSFLGLNFENEIINLSKLSEDPVRPLVFVLGGSKKDKLDYLEFLGEWCDKVLVGGKLPSEIFNLKFLIFNQFLKSKFLIANLNDLKKDLSEEDIAVFKEKINEAKTIIWAGPMGVYEERENQKGTFEIAKAIADSKAYKVAGGGDTHRVLGWLNLWDRFDFVSSGGGAMLAFLKNKTLVGIRAITGTNVKS